jgi:hypothetical protein
MAAAPLDICNLALSFLGAGQIQSLTQPTNTARVLNSEFAMTRDAEIRAHVWKFAKSRAALSALVAVPASGPYTNQFALPSDCLRVLMVGDSYPGIDLQDYRQDPTNADYSIEGRNILTNLPAPLAISYMAQVTDTTQFDACFDIVLAAKLAWKCCERITQSADKRKLAIAEYKAGLMDALRANAIEGPPVMIADGPWLIARLQ